MYDTGEWPADRAKAMNASRYTSHKAVGRKAGGFFVFISISAFFAVTLWLAPGKNLTAKHAKEMHAKNAMPIPRPTGSILPNKNYMNAVQQITPLAKDQVAAPMTSVSTGS